MKKKRIIIYILLIIIACALAVMGYLYFTTPNIIFSHEPEIIEINSKYDAMSFIKKVEHSDIKQVSVKDDKVNNKKLGTYQILYAIKDQTFALDVQVKDTKKPEVTTKPVSIEIGEAFDLKDGIKEIKDDTKTTVVLKNKDEAFDKTGKKNVDIIVKDEGGNETIATIPLTIQEKDKTPPVIKAENITLQAGDSFDALYGVSANDARDGKVKVTVIKNDVDTEKAGTYHVTYESKDKHHNRSEKTITVTVTKPQPVSGKVIYLTIDDGPSANTPAILDILDQYNVKATFFVTAQSPGYLDYIRIAHEKGHAIGLHTYSHNYAQVYANEAAYFSDLQAISDVVYEKTGVRSHIIRFPGGSSNTVSANYNSGIMSRLSKEVQNKGYQYFDWNAASGDGNSALPASTLIQTAKSYGNYPSVMMLTHDHSGSHSSVEALPEIISYYQNLGYTFETVDVNTNGYHHGINN